MGKRVEAMIEMDRGSELVGANASSVSRYVEQHEPGEARAPYLAIHSVVDALDRAHVHEYGLLSILARSS